MALQLHNVRTRQTEPFRPLHEGRIGFYLCGLTVYDHMHIGHGRTAVSFEIIRRWLERDHNVTFVQNVTDVEDKILARAKELDRSPLEHAREWDQRAKAACARLGVRPPDQDPHVTDSIGDIIGFIEGILANGFAYVSPEGNVYFDVPAYEEHARQEFPEHHYGCLSNRDYREMAAGTRKDVEADKRHPADFALWKAAKEGDHPDSCWSSPWGEGRPGWHIECSLMSTRALGDRIDIHGGGQDLIFPHHENEIAQSQAKTGQVPFVNVWMHTGFLNVEGQKMSKSLGNFIVLEEMLDELEQEGMGAEDLRFYFALTHYRSKIDFSRAGVQEAHRGLQRIHRARRLLRSAVHRGVEGDGHAGHVVRKAAQDFLRDFDAAMDRDLHTPDAVAALFGFLRAINARLEADEVGAEAAYYALEALEDRGRILTLFAEEEASGAAVPEMLRRAAEATGVELDGADEEQAVQAVLQARQEARQAKDWARADALRDALARAGYVIEDTPQGPRWSRA